MRGVFGRSRRRIAAVVLGVLLVARVASAEEWHEAYRAGVQALARRDYQRAAGSLRRAINLRPEPGRNVLTYGTNVEPRYFPYLRLAEAYLALGELGPARETLEASATWGREPVDERRQLQARLESALEPHQPPPPTPTAPPPTTLAPPSTVPAGAPPPTTIPPAPLATPPPSPSTPPTTVASPSARPRLMPTPARQPEAGSHPPEAGSHPPGPDPAPSEPSSSHTSGTVEIVSQPPGALAYLDDEPLGSTDPETGRLLKTSLRPGRHRIRVALPGHDETVREIEVPSGGSVAFYATLRPLERAPSGLGLGLAAFGVVTVALVAVVAWMVVRRPANPALSVLASTPRPSGGHTPRVAATPPGHLSPGARRDELGQDWFGDFRLLEMLGRGGMASVYKAERGVELSALKRPLGSFLDDPEFIERFLREADIGRTLNHPNIVRILARGEVDRVPYFTMELLPGQTLQAFIKSWGAAAPGTAASIVAQVAEALDFAHSKGVIHRDLKPSNIMLLQDGTAKVMDFGIARARRFEGLTATGAFLGTPEYVAPEIVEGHGVEPRSDLYSLGVVFYELLTGQRPFTGDTGFAVLKKQCNEEAQPPSQIQAGIPAELEAIVRRLLAKTPEGRLASAEELVVTLRDWLNRAA